MSESTGNSLSYVSDWMTFNRFVALLLVLAGAAAFFFLAAAPRYLPVTGDNMYPEAAGVVASQQWAGGVHLYRDYRQPPFLVTAFPPLWYGFLAAAARFGVNDLDSLTLFGRVLSLLSLFGIALLAYRWNRRAGFSPRLSLLTPAFYLAFPILVPWAITARPDFPALCLALLAVYLVGTRSGTGFLCLGALASAASFLVRHNSVAVPVAVVLWLLMSRRWKGAATFCAVWGVAVGSTLVAFLTHGMLALNLSGAKFGAVAVTYVRDSLFRILTTPGNGFAVALFAFGFFGLLVSWNAKDGRFRLLGTYAVVSLGLAVLGTAAAGAAVNHYLEPALALALLVPPGLQRLEETWERGSPMPLLLSAILLVFLLPSLDVQRWNFMHARPENLKHVAMLAQGREVFTDIPYLGARLPAPQLLDLVSLLNTERSGGRAAWSSASLASSIGQKKFAVVILHEPVNAPYDPTDHHYPRYPRLDDAVRTAIGRNYAFCLEMDTAYVYFPRTADGPSAPGACPHPSVPAGALEVPAPALP